MPKSKHRKNQKQKSRARTKRIKEQQTLMEKKFKDEFMNQMEEFKNKELKIEEVEDEKSTEPKINS